MKETLITLLTLTSNLKDYGIKFIRIAILVVFVWIGGLKFFHYEAEGIVPFVANSPFMNSSIPSNHLNIKNIKTPKVLSLPKIVLGTNQTTRTTFPMV